VDHTVRSSELGIRFSEAGLGDRRLPAEIETACFRIVQESLNNIVKHAAAQRATVHLGRSGSEVDLLVDDDGAGFDVTATLRKAARGESFGVLGMHERANLAGGRLDITSEPGKGTRIRATFPIPR
jgi:signal transduction histidine kinase